MNLRLLGIVVIGLTLNAVPPALPTFSVEFPFDRIPRYLWARELVWLRNVGVSSIAASGESMDSKSLAGEAGLTIAHEGYGASRISILSPAAVLKSRKVLWACRPVIWTDVETEVAPQFHRGGVSLTGDEDPALQTLRREAGVLRYWAPVLASSRSLTVANRVPDTILIQQKAIPEASAVSVLNAGKQAWLGGLRVVLPSYKRTIQIPGVSVPAQDALLLPVDVAFSDPRFCRFCSGMSNSERVLYATAELTAIEYENGILSFEFYAPSAGVVVLQLEREPNGPMLAAGHPAEFDWDAESKRARLPIPAGKGPGKRVRIAVTMTAPDDVASFVDTRTMVIGQANHLLTDYSSEAFAKRSRLILPPGWTATSEIKSSTQIAYSVTVPNNRLHGDREDLRLETDGVGMSHVRVQLLRSVSVHIAEASALHFGNTAELISDPPLAPVEGPSGRNFTIQLRNNAPEIRTFRVSAAGEGLDFSPPKTELSIGASSEREISMRVFASGAGLHPATIRIQGAADNEQPVRFIVIPRGGATTYSTDLIGMGKPQTIWENARIRAVFTQPDGGRWLEFYWKESGKSFLPAEGILLTKPVKVDLHGDELTIDGITGLPRGGEIGNVRWKADVSGMVTKYGVLEGR